jgi:hypothetical protein
MILTVPFSLKRRDNQSESCHPVAAEKRHDRTSQAIKNSLDWDNQRIGAVVRGICHTYLQVIKLLPTQLS